VTVLSSSSIAVPSTLSSAVTLYVTIVSPFADVASTTMSAGTVRIGGIVSSSGGGGGGAAPVDPQSGVKSAAG